MRYDVYGIGNALVDKEFEVSDAFLAEQGIEKGFMTLIDEDRHHQLLAELQSRFGLKQRTGGGSAANTIVAASQFGASTFYACKVADDEFGEFYRQDLEQAGVDNCLERINVVGNTGKCMVMITPDAERTMNTYLGITTDFSMAELDLEALKQARYLYWEGYLVTSDTSRAAVLAARRLAAEQGIKTAMTFSDPSMVTYFRDGVAELLGDGVDILFCNTEEAQTFTGTDNLDAAIAALKPCAGRLVITLGSKGAMVVNGQGRISIDPHPVRAIDTNGAGDMFAGAFLYAISQGMDDASAGRLASLAASRIVSVYGTRLSRAVHAELLSAIQG